MKEKLFEPLKSAVALIADDDGSFRREMAVILELFFRKVIQVTNGLEALEFFEDNKIRQNNKIFNQFLFQPQLLKNNKQKD